MYCYLRFPPTNINQSIQKNNKKRKKVMFLLKIKFKTP